MNHTQAVHEQVSALADGHLAGDEFAQVIGKIGSDRELRTTWQTYHLVGDVLRSGVHSTCSDTSLFLARLQQRLVAEPLVPVGLPVQIAAEPAQRRVEAANEPVFRWKLVAGAASLAAAAAIGWNWVGTAASRIDGAQLAQQRQEATVIAKSNEPQQPAQALASTRVLVGNGNPQVMLRDPRLDQLLEAHKQVGGASQMPSGFLRNATFEGPSR